MPARLWMVDPRSLCCRRMTQRILLATTVNWPSAAYLAGAFASCGCSVEAVFPRGHVLGVSRYVGRAYAYRPLRPNSSFAEAIAAAKPDLIVPCDDRAVAHLLSTQTAALAPESRRCLSAPWQDGVLSADVGAQPRYRHRAGGRDFSAVHRRGGERK